jgi:hypothetical protein
MKFNVFIFIVRFAQYHYKSSKVIKFVIKIQVAKCLLVVYNHCHWMPNQKVLTNLDIGFDKAWENNPK